MASSTLDPDNMPEKDRQIAKGHGTRALGPSNSSDSGSDVQDGMRWTNEADIGLDRGTMEDPDTAAADRSAGPDVGDAWLDSDTDSGGTGEVASAGRDTAVADGSDISVDEVGYVDPADEPDLDADAGDVDEGMRPPAVNPGRGRGQESPR